MFRLNHKRLREIILVDSNDVETAVYVEYLAENCFNAYVKDKNGFLTSILLNAEVEMNPDTPDDLIIRTESEQYKVDYYMGQDDNIT